MTGRGQTRPTWSWPRWRRAPYLALLCTAGLLTPWLSAALAGRGDAIEWAVDLASHWQWLFLAGLLAAVALAAPGDRRWAIWLLAAPLPWLSASEPAPGQTGALARDAEVLSIATANVNLDNEDSERLRAWLDKARPAVVILQEVTDGYAHGLERLPGYPYRHLAPRRSPFGMALLSQHPFIDVRTVRDSDRVSHIEATIDWNGRPIRIIGCHPMPPLAPEFHVARNRQLRMLAAQVRNSTIPSLFAGDLNASPWSNAFVGLADAGLRRASGLAPTWPAFGHGLMGMAIDQVLVSGHWQSAYSKVGADLGSDHLPLLVGVRLR